ncbi:fibroblast growth factor receptor 2-like [Planococcus citri]|uniref:fibroblast growth factor receptor 2-like n=1 Tax=Planococcus citri TaxID=170843 RepID=UPI0031F92B53
MTSSIFLYSSPIVAFGLAVMLTTFSQAISVNSSANCEKRMKSYASSVLFTCNITKMTNTSYWYRLSPEKMMTMLEDSSDLSDYEVLKTYETSETWLGSLSWYDTGLYSCLDRSKPRGEQVICCIRLNVSCNGIEINYHMKQHLQEIENGVASPYTLKKTVVFIPRQTYGSFSLGSFTRGYPRPNYSTYKTNHGDSFGKYLKQFDDTSHLFPSKNESKMPTNYTFRTCNTKGCVDNIFHSVHQTESNTVVVGEVRGGYVTFCCDAELNSTWNVQWLIKRGKATKYTRQRRTNPKDVPCYFIINVSDADAGIYECRKQDSAWTTIATFELKIVNDSTVETISGNGNLSINGATISAENVLLKDSFRNDGLITNILFAILITALFFTIICLAYFFCRYKKEMRKKDAELTKMTKLVKKIIIQKQIRIDDDSPDNILNMPVVTIQCLRSHTPKNGMISSGVYEMPLDERWEFPRHNLRIGRTVGEGEFGIAFQAEAKNIPGRENETTIVAVKMLKDEPKDSDMIDLVSEMEILKLLGNHPNVLRLIGCCSQGGPLLVITEYAENGNLQTFLRTHPQRSPIKLPETTLMSYALQIAQGMDYLASLKCIHRDLAARNILVTADHTMKIADFGLARNVKNSEYYRKTSKGRLPIKWMAPEALLHHKYTLKSDVWSYGILLWEIATMGGNPYPTIRKLVELLHVLNQNYRMEKPPNTSTNMYNLMLDCWKTEPERRPNFSTIVELLTELLTRTEVIDESSHHLINSDTDESETESSVSSSKFSEDENASETASFINVSDT